MQEGGTGDYTIFGKTAERDGADLEFVRSYLF